MHVSQPREKTDIEKILRRVTETVSSRGMIILVSDLLADREPLFRGLEMLRHRRHDVLVFHVLDDDELTFPFAGTTRFEGMEELPQPDLRSARPARRLPGGTGRVPGRGPPRLRPPGHRLLAGQHQRLPRRRAVQVPASSHGPTSFRQGTNPCLEKSRSQALPGNALPRGSASHFAKGSDLSKAFWLARQSLAAVQSQAEPGTEN